MLGDIAGEHKKGRRLLIGTTHRDAQRLVIWDLGAIGASGHPQALDLIQLFFIDYSLNSQIPGIFSWAIVLRLYSLPLDREG